MNAGLARFAADIATEIARDLLTESKEGYKHRESRLHQAEIASRIAINLRTVAAMSEADEFTEPKGPWA
ncbi:hypothetical protein [Rhodococcus sp. 5G237]